MYSFWLLIRQDQSTGYAATYLPDTPEMIIPRAKHHKGDSWIPMDASFKQYEFSEGLDLESSVPFDAQALVDNIQQQAIINEDEGWVQNVP